MRYSGPVQFRFNSDGAKEYTGIARTFLGRMMSTFEEDLIGQNRHATLPDGTIISAYVPAKDMLPILTITMVVDEKEEKEYTSRKEYIYVLLWGGRLTVSKPISHPDNYVGFTNKIIYKISASSGELINIIDKLDGGQLDAEKQPRGFAVNKGLFFWANNGLYKDTVKINSSFGRISGATETFIVSTGIDSSKLVNFNGELLSTVIYPIFDDYGSADYGANNYGIQVYNDDGVGFPVNHYIDYDGNTLSSINKESFDDYNGSSGKDVWMYIDTNQTTTKSYVRYVNKLGNNFQSINIDDDLPLSFQFQRAGISSKRIFFLDASVGTGSFSPVYLHSYEYSATYGDSGEMLSFEYDLSSYNKELLNSSFNCASFFTQQFIANDTYDWEVSPNTLTEIEN